MSSTATARPQRIHARDVFVLIGAGSTVFTPGLLHDLAGSPVFADADVRLVDIAQEAADTMAALGRRIAAAAGSRMRVTAVPDRRQALAGARFVATTIAVGSAAAWRSDLDIPAAHGVLQTVGDSVGPGGVLRALRHVPELHCDRPGCRGRRAWTLFSSTTAIRSPRMSGRSRSTRR